MVSNSTGRPGLLKAHDSCIDFGQRDSALPCVLRRQRGGRLLEFWQQALAVLAPLDARSS